MSLSTWLSRPRLSTHARRDQRPNPASRRQKARLFVEPLESRVTPSSGISTLGLFSDTNGECPVAGLIMDSSGNLYGTATGGGANGDGTVFEVAKGSETITTLASFNGTNGAEPHSGLIMDSSGSLYGTTYGGGASGLGTVFEVAKGSGTITTLASFNGKNGEGPYGGLIMDSSGDLYGTTSEGGPTWNPYAGLTGDGTVFELAHRSSTITTLASFNVTNGEDSTAGLIMDSSGDLYGTTAEGGANLDGTVFELAHGSKTITTLAAFNGTNGAAPYVAGLIMDSSGNLYGTTSYGGASNDGTVFEVAHGSGTITTLASFNNTNGEYPEAALIMDSAGNLYGTTAYGGVGGDGGDGTVFEVANGSGTITTLASFDGTNGGLYPEAALIMDSSGNLYGTTFQGGVDDTGYPGGDGTVFEVLAHTPALSWTPAPITYGTALSSTQLDATATDSVTGATVAGTFVYTPAAGTILPGGNQTLSVTFTPTDTTEYSPITTITPLLVNPATPVLTWPTPAPITYGTPLSSTQLNGSAANPINGSIVNGTYAYTPGTGTIVARGSTILNVTFTPTDTADYTTAEASVTLVVTPSDSISTLASFSGANGANPVAGLLMDSSGNLYGTTQSGGASGDGNVFEVAKGSGTITTLASFNGTNGELPVGGLIMDSSGNLYGTTESGGAHGDGTVFELAQGSGTITTLASFLIKFRGGNKGPLGGLVMDSSGNLYGTTSQGGAGSFTGGTVFELAQGSGTITTLASFNVSNGQTPEGTLLMDSSGNLYGTTRNGGFYGAGTVFELAKGSKTITTLALFNGSNGAFPEAGLIMDSSGTLYGTSSSTVFELAKGSSTITTLASLNGDYGATPAGGLLMDSSGNLYGTTESGGANGDGTVFEVGAGSGVVTTMVSFGGSNGEDPLGGLIMDTSGDLYGTTDSGGASGDGTVFELPAALQPSIQISGLRSSAGAGASRTFTVTVPNAASNNNNGYGGTADFTSNASTANLNANDTAADMGTDPFSGVVPQKKGKASITDTLFSSITGGLSTERS
jgi:uncharacterized repeat protein (TIGR03803 family)